MKLRAHGGQRVLHIPFAGPPARGVPVQRVRCTSIAASSRVVIPGSPSVTATLANPTKAIVMAHLLLS